MISGVTTVGAVAPAAGLVEVITADAPVVGGVAVSTGPAASATAPTVVTPLIIGPKAREAADGTIPGPAASGGLR